MTTDAMKPYRDEPDRMAYHLCPVCKKPMKRVETENHGPGWVLDCKCLDAKPAGESNDR